MLNKPKSFLIVNDLSKLPAKSVLLPLKWDGFNVTYLRTASSHYPVHNHRAVQIMIPLTTDGFEAVTLSAVGSRRKSQKLNSENVFITPSYQPHTLLWERETELVMFDLEPEFIERITGEAVRAGEIEIREDENLRDSLIAQIGGALHAEFRNPSAVGKIYIESLAATLAVHLRRNYSVESQQRREFSGGLPLLKLRRAIDYIEAHLDQNLSLFLIAEAVGMSPYHFSRALKKSTGLAPHAYVVYRRIARAKQLLITTKLPVIDIALTVGFVNHSHFSTQFRKIAGVSPTAYREK